MCCSRARRACSDLIRRRWRLALVRHILPLAMSPTMRFVPIKTDDQLDLQAHIGCGTAGSHRGDESDGRFSYGARNHGTQRAFSPDDTVRRDFGRRDVLLSGRLRLVILDLKHKWDELETRIEPASGHS